LSATELFATKTLSGHSPVSDTGLRKQLANKLLARYHYLSFLMM